MKKVTASRRPNEKAFHCYYRSWDGWSDGSGGIDVTVYEQAGGFIRLGAGIQIGCNAMKVLRRFGLETIVRKTAFYPRSWNNRNYTKSG